MISQKRMRPGDVALASIEGVATIIGGLIGWVLAALVIMLVFVVKKTYWPFVKRVGWQSKASTTPVERSVADERHGEVPEVAPSTAAAVTEPAAGVLKQAAPANKRRKRRGLVAYEGVLRSAGVQRRTGVKEPYDCYCLTIASSRHGEDEQMWGVDLERALLESGAQVGDKVRVSLVDETTSVRHGQPVRKNVWAVEKIQ